MRIVLIAGLPASGKTHYARSLGGILIDDPQEGFSEFPDLHDCDLLVVTDPYFCMTLLRSYAEKLMLARYPEADIEWVFFENDPEQCQINARSRPNKPVSKFIDQLSDNYTVPVGAMTVPVYRHNG